MDENLRERCRQFVKRTPPADLGHLADSIAGRVLERYAAGIPPDGELMELVEIAIADSRETAGTVGAAAGQYLLDSAALLEEIAGES